MKKPQKIKLRDRTPTEFYARRKTVCCLCGLRIKPGEHVIKSNTYNTTHRGCYRTAVKIKWDMKKK